jgi:hypothetical protein
MAPCWGKLKRIKENLKEMNWLNFVLSGFLGLAASGSALAQGQINFSNGNIPGVVDAPVTDMKGNRIGKGYKGQLFGGLAGTPVVELMPLFPIAPFRTTAEGLGYVSAPIVEVTRVPPLFDATLVMRAFNGADWESSTVRGESNPIIINLGGDGTIPPSNLVGLHPFTVYPIPEPETRAIFGIGVAVYLLVRAKSKSG